MADYVGSLASFSYSSGSVDPEGTFFASFSYASGNMDSKTQFSSSYEYLQNAYVNSKIIYRMRAIYTEGISLDWNSPFGLSPGQSVYVYWYSYQTADINGKFSGYATGNLSNTVIQNRRVI